MDVTRKEFDELKAAFDDFIKGQEAAKESKAPKASKEAPTGEPKPKKKPSEYNLFIADEYKKIKANNPDMNNKQIFKQCTENWKKSKPAA
jgi:hypothetical protein